MRPTYAIAAILVAAALPAVEVRLNFTASPPEAAFVWYEGRTGRPVEPVVVDQVERTFTPGAVVAAPGASLRIRNSDQQQHNVFAYDERLRQDADLGLGQPGSVLERVVDWPVGEVLKHGCKIHPDMRLWVLCTTSPEAAGQRLDRTRREFILRLEGTPGAVRLWLSRGDAVTIAPGAPASLTLGGRTIGSAAITTPDPGPRTPDPK